jgi:hypothetical protein
VLKQTIETLQNLKRLALSEAWKVLQLTVASVVQVLESVATDLSGPDKKAIAIEYLNEFYDKFLVRVDVPFVPNFLEPMIHKYIKYILMTMVSASIDATVTIFRNTGVFLKKGDSV